jgi:hypothetical protein
MPSVHAGNAGVAPERTLARSLCFTAMVLAALCGAGDAQAQAVGYGGELEDRAVSRNTLTPPASGYYAPGPAPDRVVLTVTADLSRSQTVSWRTAPGASPEAQISTAAANVGLHLAAETVVGSTQIVMGQNGWAAHHKAAFTGLQPDTLYAYRVRGIDTWSEWFQFRTAPQAGALSFIYLGDTQNSIRSHASRIVREAFATLPRPALVLHAGDLISQREGNHDDEWGEWFDAGGFLYAMTPQMAVAGNHEHYDSVDDSKTLSPQFSAQFPSPGNGPEALLNTVYAVHTQDVLLVALDSTAALASEAAAIAQAQWLDQLLADTPRRWTIVSHHHPVYSVSQGRDNPALREHWQPVYEHHGVDLVLQGHDHTYGRLQSRRSDSGSTPVYVVSVAGAKMYRLSEEAQRQQQRLAEDLQLFQLVHVNYEHLTVEARTATGELYDRFVINIGSDGTRAVSEQPYANRREARCQNPAPPREDRCWEGRELAF